MLSLFLFLIFDRNEEVRYTPPIYTNYTNANGTVKDSEIVSNVKENI